MAASLFEDLGRRVNALLDEAGPSSAAAVPRLGVGGTPWPWESWLGGDKHKKQQQPSKRERTRRLDLSTLNPSLQTVGLALAERLMPRYLSKAGLACERMQHAGLPISFIGNVLEACFGEQTDQQMREVFHYFDSSGDGFLDEDEFIAISPLLAEDVPGDSLPTLMAAIDADGNGTVTCEEFVVFVRTCNPRDAGARDGWRAMLPAEGEGGEGGDAVMLAVGRRHEKEMAMKGKNRWRAVNQSDLAKQQRQKEGGRPVSELAVKRVDLDNAQTMIDKLRALRMGDAEVAAIIQALFVEKTDEAYARVFDIFDTDSTGGLDEHEFHQVTALLGNHTSEQETRALFLGADRDCNGLLDVQEFIALLKSLSPAARADDTHYVRTLMARERLQKRIGERGGKAEEQGVGATVTCKVVVVGASRAGKTHLLNQVVGEKLPKGKTLTVGFSALQVQVGHATVAVQVLDTPGDPKYAPLGRLFHGTANFCMLVFDATSAASFDALDALRDDFLEANPQYDAGRLVVVSNVARAGVKRDISSGYARDWCEARGAVAFFEVDEETSQGLLEPMRHIAQEYLSVQHPLH